MKITVKVKTNSKKDTVERISQPTLGFGGPKDEKERAVYRVAVKEAPVAGKANAAVIRALATYFGVSMSQVVLVSGNTSKQKIFEIDM